MREELKVVLVGAASPQWGHKISRDIIVALSDEWICEQYTPILVMEDVNESALEPETQLAKMVAEKAGGKVRIESTSHQKNALTGARFVVVSLAVGSLEAMQYDLEIAREYGIYMPVGDTVSIGGAIRATRNIPALLSIARNLEEVGHPEAWLFNLSNPMSILCRAVSRETSVNIVGCCHELYNGLKFLASILDFEYETWRDVLEFDILGINHCGWMQNLRIKGEDGFVKLRVYLEKYGITKETSRLYDSAAPHITRQNVKINLFLRHGVLPYSGDRHTVEFFSEFVNTQTNKGADFGVLLTTPQERLVDWRGRSRTQTFKYLNGQEEFSLELSEEAAARLIKAFLLDEELYDVSNLPYHGNELPGVPDGAVLERMATYRKSGIELKPVSPLPDLVYTHMAHIATIIEDIVEAAVTGNRQLLLTALERDPLLENMDWKKIPELVSRLLEVHKEFVHPGFI